MALVTATIAVAACARSASTQTAAPARTPAQAVHGAPWHESPQASAGAKTSAALRRARPQAPVPEYEQRSEPAQRVALGARRPPSAAATPFGFLRPHDPPRIYSVSISRSDAGAGDVVSGTVATSSNVASVVASVAGISSGVPKVGVGLFAMSYRLPPVIPPFVKGSYTIVVVARNVDGASTSRSVGITLH